MLLNIVAAAAAVPFLLSLIARAGGVSPHPMTAPPVRAALAFDQYLVDMGEVVPSEEVFAHFGFANAGKEPVTITELVPSCGCLQPQLRKKDYAAGETGHFVVRVQTANQDAGPKEYRVKVRYTDPQPREAEVLFRVVLPDNKVFVKPRALAFYQLNGQPTTQEIEVIDHRPEGLVLQAVRSSTELASAELGDPEVDDQNRLKWRVKITVLGTVPPGRRDGVVTIITNDPDYPRLRVPLVIHGPAGKVARGARSDGLRANTN
jgi:hypothetical protein